MSNLEQPSAAPLEIPETDEGKAALALHTAMTLALIPLAPAVRISALNTVLTYTKAKPAVRTDLKVSNAEQWLASVVQDMAVDNQ
jgi:hypothetical protein